MVLVKNGASKQQIRLTTVRFDNVNSGYTITIDVTCVGTVDMTINRTTVPPTPSTIKAMVVSR